jgi:GNAT superfamily N-acetyltransferase
VIVRAIEQREIAQVARWNVQLHEDENSPPMSIDAASQRIRRWLEERTFKGVVFVVDGKAVGYLLYALRPIHPDERGEASVYVRQFFIARESRRHGYGTQAFRAFVAEWVPADSKVMLDVKVSNPAGQGFWESLGFESKSVSYEHYGRKP